MSICLYCLKNNTETTFNSVEHILPESIGNTTLILQRGIVCDKCNNGVLSQLDQVLLEFDPIAFLRTYYSIPSKSGKLPTSKFGNMTLKTTEPCHINVKTNSNKAIIETSNGFNMNLIGSRKMTTSYIKKLCRSIFKVALGLIYLDHGPLAFSERYHSVRRIILGQEDFNGYLVILNTAKLFPEGIVQYNFHNLPGGLETTWVFVNLMGVTLFTDLEVRKIMGNPAFISDKATVFTF